MKKQLHAKEGEVKVKAALEAERNDFAAQQRALQEQKVGLFSPSATAWLCLCLLPGLCADASTCCGCQSLATSLFLAHIAVVALL